MRVEYIDSGAFLTALFNAFVKAECLDPVKLAEELDIEAEDFLLDGIDADMDLRVEKLQVVKVLVNPFGLFGPDYHYHLEVELS